MSQSRASPAIAPEGPGGVRVFGRPVVRWFEEHPNIRIRHRRKQPVAVELLLLPQDSQGPCSHILGREAELLEVDLPRRRSAEAGYAHDLPARPYVLVPAQGT